MTSKELTKLAVAALEDRKAEDVTVIDISEISPIADYFIIANGTNQNQLQAMESRSVKTGGDVCHITGLREIVVGVDGCRVTVIRDRIVEHCPSAECFVQ